MSDPHSTAPHDDGPHEGPIKTPKQLIIAVVASFVVPIVAIILLVNRGAGLHRPVRRLPRRGGRRRAQAG